MPNYYRPEDDDRWQGETLVRPVRCPMRKACLGTTTPGEASCAPGHTGPLCGLCDDGYYKGNEGCELCPTVDSSNFYVRSEGLEPSSPHLCKSGSLS